MDNRKFSEQEEIRRRKLTDLIENNKNPFVQTKFERNFNTKTFKETFDNFSKEKLAEKSDVNIKIPGRIRLFRETGKAVFLNIQDGMGLVQAYLRKDVLGDEYFAELLNLDLGDIIGLHGKPMKTNTGELTLRVEKFVLLSKSLKPLPDKHHGIEDQEEKYRRRYVDLIMNEKSKQVFINRNKIIRTIQKVLDKKGFVEVETPILQSIYGGAAAKPFKTHHNALGMDLFLRIATEIHLKQLVVGSMEKVYEIGRLFRNEGISTRHNPEFTSIEIYAAYKDFYYMMDLSEEIFKESALAIGIKNNSVIEYSGKKINIFKKFKRIHMVDAIKENINVDFWKKMTFEEAKEIAKKHKLEVPKHFLSVGNIINLFFEEYVEPNIIEPTFVYGHPVEISPLSKINTEDPRFTDRFELFIIGREYANAFSELNNPIEQFERFEQQIKEKEKGNEEAHELNYEFIEALEYGLPPTAGIGLGIDRLVMLLTNSNSIRDVLLFPQMKIKN